MNFSFKNSYPHFIAVVLFLLISIIYFSPVLKGFSLKQDDIDNHKGVAKEIRDHREEYGEEPLWTNSMFGGMPATQVSVIHSYNLMNYVHKIVTLGLPHPINYLFLYFLGFYILCLCCSLRPWLSILGALMFGLTSFFFISVGVGHNSKVMAMAYMPTLVGAFIYTFRRKSIVGAILFALFLALELRCNHVQITYYTFMILLFLGIYFLISHVKYKKLIPFFKKSSLLFIGGMLAILCNFGNLYMTYDYLPDSQRGESELTLSQVDNESKTSGLDLDYMTRWSYGTGESMNLIIPSAKGNGSGADISASFMNDDNLSREVKNILYQVPAVYWGNQPGTSGPVYIGISVFFLFLLGLVFLDDKIKWPLLVISILALFLSWGHNWLFLTKLFADFFPGYSKFRSVTMILVIVELIVPLVGILWLFQLTQKTNSFSSKFQIFGISVSKMHVFYALSSIFVLFLLLFVVNPGIFLNFQSLRDASLFSNPQVLPYIEDIIDYRKGFVSKDALRSLFLVVFMIASITLYVKQKIKKEVLIIALSFIVVLDLWGVSTRYMHANEVNEYESKLTNKTGLKHWQPKELKLFPHKPQPADLAILTNQERGNQVLKNKIQQRKLSIFQGEEYEDSDYRKLIADVQSFKELNFNTNYRVLELGNPLNTARTSFLHKSIGGYSAVKLKRVQEVINFYFERENRSVITALNTQNFNLLGSLSVLNMLNTQYFIFDLNSKGLIDPVNFNLKEKPGVLKNPFSLGNAWTAGNIIWVNSPDEEILMLGDSSFNPKNSVIIDKKFKEYVGDIQFQSVGTISMTDYKANHISYQFNSLEEKLVVFSEVFYDKGWKAYLDGNEVKHIRVNYILRGLKVPAGDHKIEFKYDLPIYHTASFVSFSGSFIIILLLFGLLFFKIKGREIPEL